MAKGGRVAVEKSARGISRWKGDDRDDEDEEYVAEEEDDLESESYEESLASSSDSEIEGGKSRGNSEDSSGSDDGSFDEGSDFEFDESEFEEEEEIQVKRSKKGRKKSSSGKKRMDSKRKVSQSDEDDEDFDVKPVLNQNRRRRSPKSESEGSDYEEEDDDEDFDDLDEDEDFTPDVEDEDEEIFSISKRNNGYRKEKISRSPVKRARKSKKSRVSRQKKPTTATKNKKDMKSTKKRRRGRKRSSPKEPAIKQRRRLAQIKDDDFIVDDDDDFILEDRAEAKKKKNNKRKFVSDSDTSEFEFVTSDEDDFVIQEEIKPKKRKKYTICCSGTGSDSSDSDYVIHEEEEEVVKEVRKRNREVVKGKEKEEEKEEDSGRKVCGICLSEEQRRTTRGVLDCCPHFFCFACIVEWSKVESRCPVCKRRFETITKASSSDSDDLCFGAPKKVIKVPKRDQVYQPSEEDIRGMLDPYENVVCMECQQGGDDNLMLLCDICDSSAHTYCVGLGNSVPEGNWYCDCCRSAGAGPSNLQPQPQQQPSVVPSDPAATEFEPIVNVQSTPSSSSALEIDLNASPRDVFEEAGTQVLGGPSQVPSPSAGGAATLSSRRAIRNRIRIILSNTRSMQVVRRNGEEANAVSNGIGIGLRVGRSVGQQGSILAPHRERGGARDADRAKEQVQTMVKNHLKQLCSGAPLDRDAFKEVARRATYTVLAVCGFGVEHRNLVSNSISAPMGCSHEIQDSEKTSLLAGSCSACFDSFVRDVVASILNRG